MATATVAKDYIPDRDTKITSREENSSETRGETSTLTPEFYRALAELFIRVGRKGER